MTQTAATPTFSTFWELYGDAGDAGMPKYMVLRSALNCAIADGFWKHGNKLPTEAELAEACPYSLGTVQRAMRDLVEQGVVQRWRRRGTYVGHSRELEDPWHCRFLAGDGKTFLPVFTKVVDRSTTERHGPWSRTLQQDGQTVIQIDRHMEINAEFTVFNKFFVRADRFPRFLEIPLEELSGVNLKLLIIRSVGRPLTAIREHLRVCGFPSYVCRAIDIPDASVGLHVRAGAYAADAMPVYYQEFFIPPTQRTLYMESSPPAL